MPDPVPEKKQQPSRFWRRLRLIFSILFLVGLLTLVTVYFVGYDIARMWVESPAGQHTASAGVAKLIKVDGEFSPIHMKGWTLQIDSYEGPGWPGEAIGEMKLEGMHFELDPVAIFTRWAYRINGIQITRGYIRLDKPDDALKRKMPPKPPRPWYAFLLPSQFQCGPMICPDTTLEFPFQNQSGHLSHAHVQADLIGKNLQYTATSGVLDFAYLPKLRVEYLKMLVTREEINIYSLKLAGLTPDDPARMSMSGRIGQHADKSIHADVEIVQMPIEQVLPEDLAPLIHGRASGNLVWNKDASGKNISADGELDLSGASIDDLSVFRQLTLLHGNPDLKDFVFNVLTLKFHLVNGVFTGDLIANSSGKFDIVGHISYDLATRFADLKFNFTNLPLKTWLPPEFKPRYAGAASAELVWHGRLTTIKQSSGYVFLNLDDMRVNNPPILRHIMQRKGFNAPDELYYRTAEFSISYKEDTFSLDLGKLYLPGILWATITGTLTSPNDILDARIDWTGLTLKNWLPDEMADQYSGDVNGHLLMHVEKWQLGHGTYSGHVDLSDGRLRYTGAQIFAARFLGDRRLFEIPLTQASFNWNWSPTGFSAQDIDFRGNNDFGVRGGLSVSTDQKLTGILWIGTRKKFLDSLAGLADNVFTRKENGLYWAKMTLSGTAKKPGQDLGSQLMEQLPSHPGAIFVLTGKAASWYLGNLIGVDDDWLPPLSVRDADKKPNQPAKSGKK